MRRVFKNIKEETINEVTYTLDFLRINPGVKIYLGTDSQKRKKTIEYATVIAYRYGRRGCHFIFSDWSVRRSGYGKGEALISRRLTEEIIATMEVAERLRENSIQIYQIDLDINEDKKWFSNRFVQMGIGWARGLGYNVAIKPEELVATRAANKIVNRKKDEL